MPPPLRQRCVPDVVVLHNGALHHPNLIWDELFPAEQARLVQLLVELGTQGSGSLHPAEIDAIRDFTVL